MQITEDKLIEILKEDVPWKHVSYCEILAGLNLIKKYLPNAGIACAEHDQIWSDAEPDDLVKAGITEEDAKQLRDWGWMYDESLTHFA